MQVSSDCGCCCSFNAPPCAPCSSSRLTSCALLSEGSSCCANCSSHCQRTAHEHEKERGRGGGEVDLHLRDVAVERGRVGRRREEPQLFAVKHLRTCVSHNATLREATNTHGNQHSTGIHLSKYCAVCMKRHAAHHACQAKCHGGVLRLAIHWCAGQSVQQLTGTCDHRATYAANKRNCIHLVPAPASRVTEQVPL